MHILILSSPGTYVHVTVISIFEYDYGLKLLTVGHAFGIRIVSHEGLGYPEGDLCPYHQTRKLKRSTTDVQSSMWRESRLISSS